MVAFYVDKIKKGEMKIEEIPTMWRKKVQIELYKETLTTL